MLLDSRHPFKNLPVSSGFTLIEIIISIAVLLFGIIAVYSAFSMMIAVNYTISEKVQAAYLAQEGLEIIRNMRDNNFLTASSWDSGLVGSPCSSGCMADYTMQNSSQLVAYDSSFLGLNSDGFYGYGGSNTPTIFQRKITTAYVPETSDALYVNVQVLWNYNNQSYSYSASEYLYNWH